MRRLAGPLGAVALVVLASPAQAETADDPIGDLIVNTLSMLTAPAIPDWRLKATLYHAGAAGVGALDSIGCKPVAMRTAATDPRQIPRRTVLFIKEQRLRTTLDTIEEPELVPELATELEAGELGRR